MDSKLVKEKRRADDKVLQLEKDMRKMKLDNDDKEETKDEQIGELGDKLSFFQNKLRKVKEALNSDDPDVARHLLQLRTPSKPVNILSLIHI